MAPTLYQVALCPMCNEVRAGLQLKGTLKRNGRTDAHAWVHENWDYFERELGEHDGNWFLRLRVTVVSVRRPRRFVLR